MKTQTEAIILAGGKGSRLIPLTENTPKPLLKISGKTVLELLLDRVSMAGIQRAVITTGYLPWQIEVLGPQHGNTKITYVRENEPLGTAGAVRGAYDGNADYVLVLSGDGLFDFDLKKVMDFHLQKNADVTVVTHHSENPLEYGVVLYNHDGRIIRFEEKPPWSRVVSGEINTGIYVINKGILNKIPKDCQYDFSKELFPLLLAQNRLLYAYNPGGEWHDIGNFDEYFEANKAFLEGRLKGITNDGFTKRELDKRGIDAEEPFYASTRARIGSNVKIGAYSVIGDDVVISEGCDISASIICDKVSLGIGCGIYGSIIGRESRLGENCIISEGSVLGAGVTVNDSVILPKYSFIHSGEVISHGEYREKSCGKREKTIFTDEGVICDTAEKSPQYIMQIGYAAARTLLNEKHEKGCRIGVMTQDNRLCSRVGKIILEGIAFAGVRSIDYGSGYRSMARFAARELIGDIIIYVYYGNDGKVYGQFFNSQGIEVSTAFERKMSKEFFSNGEYSPPERLYECDKITDISMIYYSNIIKTARKLSGSADMSRLVFSFDNLGEIKTGTPSYTALCILTELGATATKDPKKADITFELDAFGEDTVISYKEETLDSFHINGALLSQLEPKMKGEQLYFSSTMPDAYKKIASDAGFSVQEYAPCTINEPSKDFIRSAERLCFLYDGVLRAVLFAVMVSEKNIPAEELLKDMPAFEIYTKSFDGSRDRATVMQRLSELTGVSSKSDRSRDQRDSPQKAEGIRLELSKGVVTVIPNKKYGFKIISEATSMEAAKELCREAEDYLK